MKNLLVFYAILGNALVIASAFAQGAVAAPTESLAGGQTGRIEFASITPTSMWTYARKNMTDTKQVVVYGDLLLPKNVAVGTKAPALVVMHGSGGVEPWAYDLWAARMNAAGVAVFVVDSYKPRGVDNTSTDQLGTQVTLAGQIADSLNALRVLATHPALDASRIFVIGMSRGANAAFYTAWPMYQRPVDTGGARFAGHIAAYPGMCNIRYRADAGARATAPIFMALPDRKLEDLQDVAVCERYASELAAAGNPVTIKEYSGAYHAWDGGARRFRFENAHSAKPCDMELQMTDVAGGGVGKNARDLKTGRAIAGYDDWNAAIKGCMATKSSGIGGNPSQSDALVKDVLTFMGTK